MIKNKPRTFDDDTGILFQAVISMRDIEGLIAGNQELKNELAL